MIFPYLPHATARFPQGYPFSWNFFVYGKRATFGEIDVTIEGYCAVDLVDRPKAEDDPGVAGYIRNLSDTIQKQFAKRQLKDEHPEQSQEKLATLFISYSQKDSEFVHRLADDLRTAGYSVWVDVSGLRGGQEWAREIDKAVRGCDTFILIISPDSMASRWVSKETLLAMDLEKPVVPVMWREAERPMHLVDIQYVEFRGAYDDAMQELYEALPPATFPPNSNPSPSSSMPSLPNPKRLATSC